MPKQWLIALLAQIHNWHEVLCNEDVLRHEYCIVWQWSLGNVKQKLHCLLDDDGWLNGHLKSVSSV